MKKYISVPNETKRDLRKVFNCTKEMVWMALNYKSDSDLAKRIRKFAIDKGGVTKRRASASYNSRSTPASWCCRPINAHPMPTSACRLTFIISI